MTWRDIWYDPRTHRLRSGWRAVVFLLGAIVLTELLKFVISKPFLFNKIDVVKMPLWAAAIGGAAMAIACYGVGHWMARTFEALTPNTLGMAFEDTWLQRLLGGLVVGFLIILLLLGVLQTVGLARITWALPSLREMGALGGLALLMLVLAAGDRLLLHGYFFQTLLRGAGMPAAVLITAVMPLLLFGMKSDQPIGVVNGVVWTVLFAMLYLRSGSLWLPIGVSAGWNFGLLCFHLPMAGLQAATPFRAVLYGSPILTGGAAGPENGAIISVVLLALLAAVVYSRHGRALASAWWEWRELALPTGAPPAWDFAIDTRYYQWRLPQPDDAE
jgi:hypothetical protein